MALINVSHTSGFASFPQAIRVSSSSGRPFVDLVTANPDGDSAPHALALRRIALCQASDLQIDTCGSSKRRRRPFFRQRRRGLQTVWRLSASGPERRIQNARGRSRSANVPVPLKSRRFSRIYFPLILSRHRQTQNMSHRLYLPGSRIQGSA